MGYLQLNDPDPLYWVTVYTLTGITPFKTELKDYYSFVVWLTSGMVLAGLLQSLPGFIDFIQIGEYGALTGAMSATQPTIEAARELIGLLFCAVFIGHCLKTMRVSKSAK